MPALVVASAFLAGALVVGGVPPGGRVRTHPPARRDSAHDQGTGEERGGNDECRH